MGYMHIENLYKSQDILLFKECYAMEKVHGCLDSQTRILLPDMSTSSIGALVNKNMVGTEVLGVNSDGGVVPSRILAVHNNGKEENWLNVKGTRRGIGRGKHFFSINCTKNHHFFTSKGYISAQQLKKGDTVYLIRNELELTPLQHSILLGKLLGDGCIKLSHHTASIEFGHKNQHEEYVDFILMALGCLAGEKQNRISGYGTEMVAARTLTSHFIFKCFSDFIQEGKKTIPDDVIDKINPIVLAILYMDDGSLSHHKDQEDRALFALCNFTKKQCEVIQKALCKFGIRSEHYFSEENYSRLRLNSDDSERFYLLIAPYVIPCMQYKLPTRYRGANQSWLPSDKKIIIKLI